MRLKNQLTWALFPKPEPNERHRPLPTLPPRLPTPDEPAGGEAAALPVAGLSVDGSGLAPGEPPAQAARH